MTRKRRHERGAEGAVSCGRKHQMIPQASFSPLPCHDVAGYDPKSVPERERSLAACRPVTGAERQDEAEGRARHRRYGCPMASARMKHAGGPSWLCKRFPVRHRWRESQQAKPWRQASSRGRWALEVGSRQHGRPRPGQTCMKQGGVLAPVVEMSRGSHILGNQLERIYLLVIDVIQTCRSGWRTWHNLRHAPFFSSGEGVWTYTREPQPRTSESNTRGREIGSVPSRDAAFPPVPPRCVRLLNADARRC